MNTMIAARVVQCTLLEVGKNLMMGVPAVQRQRCQHPRTNGLPDADNPDDVERYALMLLRRVLAVRPIGGLDIFELGPGDNLASGLAFLAAGAKSYTCADRFVGPYSSPDAMALYRSVRDRWPADLPQWQASVDPSAFPANYPVRALASSVEDLRDIGTFDIVGSFAVGEHVLDIGAFAAATARLLKPGGVAVHYVDFGPHGCWRDFEDPLMFLRFPGSIWRWMGSNRGNPNRHRFHEFVAAFEKCGLSVSVINRKMYSEVSMPARLEDAPVDSVATENATFILTH
jgi:SAM-dependent methyltransferase